MAHIRKQIRDRIEAVLSSAVTAVSGRVYASRVYPLSEAKLPALTLSTGSETSDLITIGVKTLSRALTVHVDAYVRVTDTFDDSVDAIAVEIEEALAADFTVNGLAKDIVLTGTDVEFSGETEQPLGIARLTFRVRYVTSISDVETAR
jgi:hypothetical protein